MIKIFFIDSDDWIGLASFVYVFFTNSTYNVKAYAKELSNVKCFTKSHSSEDHADFKIGFTNLI